MKDVSWEYLSKDLKEYEEIVEKFDKKPVELKSIQKRKYTKAKNSRMKLRIYASPIRLESINDFSELNYGIDLEANDFNSTDYRMSFQGLSFDATDAVTSERFSQNQLYFELMALQKTFIAPSELFAGVEYFTQKQGEIFPYKSQLRIFPIGIERTFEISKILPDISIYYAPIIERYTMEKIDSSGSIISESVSGLRHLLGFRFTIAPSKTFEVLGEFKIRPFNSIKNEFKVSFDDLDFFSEISFRYYPSNKFFVDYTNSYSIDQRRELYTNLQNTNTIHSFNLNYRTDLDFF